jgi:hypothetical protein
VKDAENEARDEVWASYRFVVLADSNDPGGLKIIDLGAGNSSESETLCGRIINALKANGLLNETVGSGYIDRNWPPAFKDTGAWPLAGLRQSFLNGSLTRLLDPDGVLKRKIVGFVSSAEFGLASGPRPDGGYERLWYDEVISPDEVTFEPGVVLLKKARAKELKAPPPPQPTDTIIPPHVEPPVLHPVDVVKPPVVIEPSIPALRTIKLTGNVPAELWNRLGTKMVPKLRSGRDLKINIHISVTLEAANANGLQNDLKQILADLGLQDAVELTFDDNTGQPHRCH